MRDESLMCGVHKKLPSKGIVESEKPGGTWS